MPRTLQLSFSAGEISPEMQGRIDARDYANGSKLLANFLPKPQGAVTRRPGLQFVGSAHANANASNLIPFVYSTDQALAVELADQAIRFHTQGASLQWATRVGQLTQSSSSISVGAGTITFDRAHGLSANDALRFSSTGTLPVGLNLATTYYAIVVDSHTIQVSLSAGPGAPVTLGPSVNSGTMRAFLASSMPRDYVTQEPVSSWDHPGSRIVFLGAHVFETGDAIKISDSGGATYPGSPALNSVDVYYAIDFDATSVQLAATKEDALAGTPINFSGGSSPSGTFNVDRHYFQGDLFWWTGAGAGAYHVKTTHTASPSVPNGSAIYLMPDDGTLEIPSPYAAADVFAINYAQSNDVMTLVHEGYAPRELRRLGATQWDLQTINFGSSVAAPTDGAATEDRGEQLQMRQAHVEIINATSVLRLEFETEHNLSKGDAVFVESVSQSIGFTAGNYYIFAEAAGPADKGGIFRSLDGEYVQNTLTVSVTGVVFYASTSADNEQSYKLTSVDPNGVESTASDPFIAGNNLDVSGANNVLSWTGAVGAQKYYVYKEQNGLYGRIGETEGTTFTDDGIDPDLALTPPIADEDLSGTDYPRAVAYFEQRRVFGGTTEKPRQLWMTKSGTESDLTYSLPVQEDDRITVALAARKAATVRHIVPLADMLLLTQQGEWRVTAVNSDAITPESIAVRQQSEIGANDVPPVVVNNVVVFAANRGGHVRELAFNWQAQGYVTGDLSLRAAHLFDRYTIADADYQKSPYPVCWFVSTSGKLLSLTYVPEESVRGWAQHDTDGTFESVCVIPEGDQDSIYACVQRTVNGSTVRNIERMVPTVTASLTDDVYLDGAATYDGTNTGSTTLKVSGGSQWLAGESVTVTASATTFRGRDNLGDELEVGGARIQITGYTSPTVVTGKLLAALPAAAQNTATTTWAYATKTIDGLDHLEGATVTVVRDGQVEATTKTVIGGQITLDANGAKVHVGLPFTSELETLPLVMQQIDGAGQGRRKNVSKVHVRVVETAGLRAGKSAADLQRIDGVDDAALTTGEQEGTVPGKWDTGGSVLLRVDKPVPATVLGMTLEVEVGD